MVGLLFGHLAAGAAQGIGQGMVEQERRAHEAFMEEVRHSRALALEDRRDTRDDRRAERDMGFRREEAEAGRSFTADQNRLNRESQGQLVTGGDGRTFRVQGTRADPVMFGDEPFTQGQSAGLTAEEARLLEQVRAPFFNETLGTFTDEEGFRSRLREVSPQLHRKLYGAPSAQEGRPGGRQAGTSPNRAIPLTPDATPETLEAGRWYANAQGKVLRWDGPEKGFYDPGSEEAEGPGFFGRLWEEQKRQNEELWGEGGIRGSVSRAWNRAVGEEGDTAGRALARIDEEMRKIDRQLAQGAITQEEHGRARSRLARQKAQVEREAGSADAEQQGG